MEAEIHAQLDEVPLAKRMTKKEISEADTFESVKGFTERY